MRISAHRAGPNPSRIPARGHGDDAPHTPLCPQAAGAADSRRWMVPVSQATGLMPSQPPGGAAAAATDGELRMTDGGHADFRQSAAVRSLRRRIGRHVAAQAAALPDEGFAVFHLSAEEAADCADSSDGSGLSADGTEGAAVRCSTAEQAAAGPGLRAPAARRPPAPAAAAWLHPPLLSGGKPHRPPPGAPGGLVARSAAAARRRMAAHLQRISSHVAANPVLLPDERFAVFHLSTESTDSEDDSRVAADGRAQAAD